MRNDITISYGKQKEAYLAHYEHTSERALFYYLINIDEYPSVGPCAEKLVSESLQKASQTAQLPSSLTTFAFSPEALEARVDSLRKQTLKMRSDNIQALNIDQLKFVAAQYSPSALLDGCWLQSISMASNCHHEIIASLFHHYAEKIGDSYSEKHYGNQYRNLLHSLKINLAEVNSRVFTTNNDLKDCAFTGPVLQLALSLFPRTHLPELIGLSLGHAVLGSQHLLGLLADEFKKQHCDTDYIQYYGHSKQSDQNIKYLQEVVLAYLNTIDEAKREEHWQRIWTGLVAQVLSEKALIDCVLSEITSPLELTPHEKMLAMVTEKAPYAKNMHRQKRFGKRYIDDWFAEEPFDAEGFLEALVQSPYINIKSPEKSTLITRSVSFGGPMFRIFTAAEQTIIDEWVMSLKHDSEGLAHNKKLEVQQKNTALTKLTITPPYKRIGTVSPDLATYAKCKKRELYYYFVNADIYPDIRPTAERVANAYFSSAKAAMKKSKLPELQQFFEYSHDEFDKRVIAIYESETEAYRPLVGHSTVPREIMVWFVQQYAAFTMADGAWVQNIAKAGSSHTELSAGLFQIYSDEVGNANTVMNHPNVYRKMLEGEGIHMPPTASKAFAMQPELLDFAFDLPLLTLSISMFPKKMLPEIIGVNLGIELSGLGKDYMTIIDELRFWKIDPYFFTLHLTIDNIASGHTAVAMRSVHLYLDQILNSSGYEQMQQDWERIWIAYLAYTRVAKSFETTLENKAGLRFLKPLLKLKWAHRKSNKQTASAVN